MPQFERDQEIDVAPQLLFTFPILIQHVTDVLLVKELTYCRVRR